MVVEPEAVVVVVVVDVVDGVDGADELEPHEAKTSDERATVTTASRREGFLNILPR